MNKNNENQVSLSSNMEDYLETIYLLKKNNEVVRVKQIAEKMDVKMASVTGALKLLNDKGLVLHDKYGYVDLTKQGQGAAKKVYQKHKVLTDFFVDVLKIKQKIASKNACKMEHVISKELLDRMIIFLDFFNDNEMMKNEFIKQFENYIQEND